MNLGQQFRFRLGRRSATVSIEEATLPEFKVEEGPEPFRMVLACLVTRHERTRRLLEHVARELAERAAPNVGRTRVQFSAREGFAAISGSRNVAVISRSSALTISASTCSTDPAKRSTLR